MICIGVTIQGAEVVAGPVAQDRGQKEYIASYRESFSWFDQSASGFVGLPYILVCSLAELAPEIFGAPNEKFSAFGFHPFEGSEGTHLLPRGFGVVEGPGAPGWHVTNFSCSACHTGRVRLRDESFLELVGGTNNQIDVRKWRKSLEVYGEKHLSPESIEAEAAKLKQLIDSKPKHYFYGETDGGMFPKVTEAQEQRERELLVGPQGADNGAALKYLGKLKLTINFIGYPVQKQLSSSYAKLNQQWKELKVPGGPLDGGTPGQSDGTGDLLPKFVLRDAFERSGTKAPQDVILDFLTKQSDLLAKSVTLTKIPTVWLQRDRHNGQYDNSVPWLPARNIAAQMAVIGTGDIVYENAVESGKFITDLPAPAYPFPIDKEKASRGSQLFERNCAVCHDRSVDQLYYQYGNLHLSQSGRYIGTDPNRADVYTPAILEYIERLLRSTLTQANAQFNGRLVEDRTTPDSRGYAARPLHGCWAAAPYLHNGSVPTLRHLLVPDSRPNVFVVGSSSFDERSVGWAWDPAKLEQYRAVDKTAALFYSRIKSEGTVVDGAYMDGAANIGHDQDIIVDGVLRRLNWGDPILREPLDELLEYLKEY